MIPLLLAILGLIFGAAIGVIRYATSPRGFESQKVVRILPSYTADPGAPHIEMIKGMLTIEQTLARDGGKLRMLNTFAEMPSDEMANYVSEHLIVDSLTDNSVLRLRLITPDKGDSPTLLNNLTQTYEEMLQRKMDKTYELEIASTRKLLNEFTNQYKQQKQAIQALRNKRESAVSAHNQTAKIAASREPDKKKNETEKKDGSESRALGFHSLHEPQGRNDALIEAKIQDQLAEIELTRASLNTIKRKSLEIENAASSSVAYMKRIEHAREGKHIVRASLDEFFYMAIGGMAIGLIVGIAFSLIIK